MMGIELTIQSNEALDSSVVGIGGVSPGLFSPVLPSPLIGVVVGTFGLFITVVGVGVVGVAIPPAVLKKSQLKLSYRTNSRLELQRMMGQHIKVSSICMNHQIKSSQAYINPFWLVFFKNPEMLRDQFRV
ncbi:hypothetical protein CRYUN_Cryun36dG0035800 [Craigia yunnanensis]